MVKQKEIRNVSWRKLIVLISVFIVLILFPIALYLYFSKSPEGVAWIDPNWLYRRSILVSNNSGSELINEDVLVTINTEELINTSWLQADCDDLRFTDSDTSTVLDYWVEGGCDTTATRVWVRIPSLPIGGKKIYVYYANPSATNAEETWSGVFITGTYGVGCPTGWSNDDYLDGRFPYGSSTAGDTGGATSHSHGPCSATTDTVSHDSYPAGSTSVAGEHNHNVTVATGTANNVLPPYTNILFCDNDKYDPFTGMVTMFDDTLPDGWSFNTILNGKFSRGGDSGGGGSEYHDHTYDAGQTQTTSEHVNVGGSGFTAATTTHTHSWSSGTLPQATNMPPYIKVAWAYSSAATIVDEAIFMVTANPPLGWTAQSQYNGKFFLGATTNLGTTGGASTHTHTKSFFTNGASATVAAGFMGGAVTAGTGDVHHFSITTNEQSNLPPYYTVIVSKRNVSQSATLGDLEYKGIETPTIGTPSALSTTSIRWNFTDNSSEEVGFKVFGDTDCVPHCPDPFDAPEFGLMVTCATPDISYCDETGLSENTQYTRKVTSYNSGGLNSPYSETASIYTLVSTPTISYGGNKTESSIYLQSSDAVNGSEMYFDCMETDCDTGINEWVSSTNDLAENLTPNSGYNFRVKSRNGDNVETAYSDSEEIYTLAQVPTLSINEVSDTTISLKAENVNNLAVGQSGVYFDCISDNCDTGINEWVKSDTDVSINLSLSTQYTFRVKARNSDAVETAYSDTVSIYTGVLVPNAPEVLSASTNSITVRIKSDSNPSTTTYAIYEEITGKYVNYSTNALVSSPVWGTRAQFGSDSGTLINGLSAGTAYKFKTKAKNIADSETSYSSTTSTATLLYTPTAGSASNISTSSVTWNFTDTNSNESGVRVYNENNQLVKECAGSNITYCTETNLNANVTYRRHLKAYNSASLSASSQVITATTLGEPASILSLVNSTYNSVIMSLSSADVSTVQIYEPIRALYFNGSLGVLGSLPASVAYSRSITIEGLLPNTLYTFRVKSFNVNGIETPWSSNKSIVTLAQVPSILSVQRVSSDTIRVFLDNLYNPTTTQFSIKEVNSGKYLDYQTGTLETAEKWGTFTEYGGSNGVLVRNIDPSLQYGFSARARNSENVNTSFGDAKYIGTKAILVNVPSTIKVALTQDEKVIPTELDNALYGEQSVRVKSGEYLIADVPVVFSRDRDWSSVVANLDAKNYKAVVKFQGDTGVEKPFTLYVLQGETNSLVVCPNATAIEDISVDCTGGVKYTGSFPQTKKVEGNDVSVSQVILAKVKYWVADGLVGTGAQGYIAQEREEEPKQGGGILPTITFQPVVEGINSVIDSVKETTVSVLDNTPVKDLTETELKNISVATSVVTIAVSTGVMLGSLPQMVYLLIQTVLGILSALGFRRKRVYYGYVYDSYSKEPIDGAVVRIYNTEKSLIETAITDTTGKFFGNLPQGEYILEVKKRGYVFPSSYIKGEDYPIQNVYRGSINISDTKSELEVAIPMDREELSGSRRLFISFKKIFSILLSILNILIFIGGIFIYVYMYSKYPNTGNFLIGFIYIPAIYFIGRSMLGKYMNYGRVVDRKGNRLKDISVVLKDKEFNRIVNKRVTDEKGRYRFVVNKGVYLLDIDEANYKVDKIEKGNDIEVKKNNGIVSRKIIVKKS